ncbi:MAG: DUF4132 domain-containing protein [Planctomycetota bacterium]
MPHDDALLDAFLRDLGELAAARWAQFDSTKEILARPAEERADIALRAIERLVPLMREDPGAAKTLSKLKDRLLKKPLPFEGAQRVLLCRGLKLLFEETRTIDTGILSALEQAGPITEHGEAYLDAILESPDAQFPDARVKKQLPRIRALMGEAPIRAGEPWSDQARSDLSEMPAEKRLLWTELIRHCAQATESKPTQSWDQEAKGRIAAIGPEAVAEKLRSWLPLTSRPADQEIAKHHVDVLRGLCWCCAHCPGEDLPSVLSGVAISAYQKLPVIGPRCPRLGNAAITTLSGLETTVAARELSILLERLKTPSAANVIEHALERLADSRDISRTELEESSVPDFGMTEVGVLEAKLGDVTARLEIVGAKVRTSWLKSTGRALKSAPKSVREAYPEDVKHLTRTSKDMTRLIPAQCARLEAFYLESRSWTYEAWKERYLDHPFLGTLARRLLWRFERDGELIDGIWDGEQLADREGNPLGLEAEQPVRLWHPIEVAPEERLAWQEWLDAKAITQPFKQAHREIYELTPRERAATAHKQYARRLVEQHVFHALCQRRGWSHKRRLLVDEDYPPAFRNMPAFGIRAELWVYTAGDEIGVHTSDSGAFRCLSVDQLRFCSNEAPLPAAHPYGDDYIVPEESPLIPLKDIPSLVLSEILRDVDLFVSVADVGRDAQWPLEEGRTEEAKATWRGQAFGDLSPMSQARRRLLERVVPRLDIADRCRVEGRYLLVEGDLRSYRIHVGSGHVLMDPNDEILIAARPLNAKSEPPFLPFEGDSLLSQILRDAFTLANDSAIQDETLLEVIRRGAQ